MRKPAFCSICKNKELRSICTADQHLCFHYVESTIHLFPKFFVIFYFSSDTEIHDTETRIETKKYTIDTHIYRFNIKHA